MHMIISKYDETWYQAYPKDGFIITRSVSEKMDNILKSYEVLVLCAPAYKYFDQTLVERRHNVNVMACSGYPLPPLLEESWQ